MAISFVNFSGGGVQNGPFTTVVSSAQNVSSGNSLVIGLRWGTTSISDNAGNTYRNLTKLLWPNGNLGEGNQWFLCNNCVGNSNLQVTGNLVPTSQALDTYTTIGVWQFSGGTLVYDQGIIGNSGSSSTTQTVTVNPHYQQSVVCLIDMINNLSTYSASGGLTLDGGSSVNGQQIAGASHQIFNNGFQSQTFTMTSGTSAAWQLAGPVFGVVPRTPPPIRNRRASAAATSPLFTGRLYASYITLERLF